MPLAAASLSSVILPEASLNTLPMLQYGSKKVHTVPSIGAP